MSNRSTFLPFAAPDIGPEEIDGVREVLEAGWITTGPRTRQFEAEFAEAVSAKHAIAVNSCTAALHLALEAVGIQRDDEVIVPAYTFAATAEVVRYFGARPVIVDIDRDTFNIDPHRVSEAITARTRAVIPVHVGGLAADLDALAGVCRDRPIAIVEDAAHSFPASFGGRPIGSISAFTCFSFYATKTIATGEGGMITTDDDEWADRCRIMSLHGISRDAWKRYTAEGSWYYEIIAPGFKYNMSDIAAALGVAQLRRAEAMRRRRQEIAVRYTEAFSPIGALELPADRRDDVHAWHLYMLRLNLERLTIDRARFIEELKARNIGASVHFIPLHLHPYYRDLYGFSAGDFPVAWSEYQREVSLPIYSRMSDRDVDDVIDAVIAVVAEAVA